MKKTRIGIWDYDISKLDLKNESDLLWYLKRKIEFADWKAIDRKTLIQYLSKIKVNKYVKKVLAFSLAK